MAYGTRATSPRPTVCDSNIPASPLCSAGAPVVPSAAAAATPWLGDDVSPVMMGRQIVTRVIYDCVMIRSRPIRTRQHDCPPSEWRRACWGRISAVSRVRRATGVREGRSKGRSPVSRRSASFWRIQFQLASVVCDQHMSQL
ncbi:hypothetical protein GCM10010430_13820 [Kitasatospora cystarginea]|uniref:Uncharacterized protein n=1 Tax=Kitasatospora cystarginea TaxID=58350 RepID=A0ABN3DKB9_9ACTN